jgi:hypothetical protein
MAKDGSDWREAANHINLCFGAVALQNKILKK